MQNTVKSRLTCIDGGPPRALRAWPLVTLPWGVPDGKPVTRELMFTTSDGRAFDRSAFNRLWRAAWRAAGVDPERGRQNGCHVLRHTAASARLSAGLSLAKVAAYLGDTKEVVLATYAHFMPDDDDRAREIMNAFFAPTREGADRAPCALIGPGGRHEEASWLVRALPLSPG
jgi:integrase